MVQIVSFGSFSDVSLVLGLDIYVLPQIMGEGKTANLNGSKITCPSYVQNLVALNIYGNGLWEKAILQIVYTCKPIT